MDFAKEKLVSEVKSLYALICFPNDDEVLIRTVTVDASGDEILVCCGDSNCPKGLVDKEAIEFLRTNKDMVTLDDSKGKKWKTFITIRGNYPYVDLICAQSKRIK